MDRNTAIEKIKKCLALSKSSNPNEAATALRQAQKLMEAYQVEQADVDLSCVSEHDARVASGGKSAWLTRLASVCADAFGCLWLLKEGGRSGNHVTFIGANGADQVAGYAFEVLLRQAARDRAAHVAAQPAACKRVTLIARGDAFATAWVNAASALVRKLAGQEQQALLLEEYKARRFTNLKSFQPVRRDLDKKLRVNSDSYAKGHRSGANARLDNAVGNRRQELLG